MQHRRKTSLSDREVASPATRSVAASRRPFWLVLGIAAGAAYLLAFYAAPLPSFEAMFEGQFYRFDLIVLAADPASLAAAFFGDPPQVVLRDRLAILAAAAAIAAVAAAAGWLLLAALGLDRRLDRLETAVFALAAGMNVVSTYVLAVGLLGWIHHLLVYTVPAALVLAAAGRISWRRSLRPPTDPHARRGHREAVRLSASPAGQSLYPSPPDEAEPLGPRWLWAALPFTLVILFGGLLPPIDFDVREYHLQAPKEFYQQGRVDFLPHNVYGNMPLGATMPAAAGMAVLDDWWRGALVGKTLVAAFAPLTALALFAAGRRFFNSAAVGALAAVVFLSTPWIVQVSTLGLVEGASACYLFLAFYAFACYRGNGASEKDAGEGAEVARRESPGRDGAPGSLAMLAAAGYFAGAGLAVKYPAALLVIVPLVAATAFGVWRSRAAVARRPDAPLRLGSNISRIWLPVAVVVLAVAAGGGLWLAKNAALSGNPTYPLLYRVFGGATRTEAKDRQWQDAHRPDGYHPAMLAADLRRLLLGSEWHSPLVMPLAALALVRLRRLDDRRRRTVLLTAGYAAFVLMCWWLFTHRIDRFWLPALPLLALLAGVGAGWSSAAWWRRTAAAVVGLALLANLVTVVSGACGDNHYFRSLAHLRADPLRVDPWHLHFNAHWPGGRLLTVGDAAVFDLAMPIDYNTCFDDCRFELLVKDRSPDEIRAALADREITHVYIAWHEIARYRRTYGYSDFIQPEVVERLVAADILEPLPLIDGHPGRGYRVVTTPAGVRRAP